MLCLITTHRAVKLTTISRAGGRLTAV